MAPSSKGRGHSERDELLGAFVAGAAKILAPNSLQFDDNEFERSPVVAKEAAIEAAKLVQPGDLIFITTRGFLYSMGRYLTNNEYDHVVIVLNDHEVLHVGHRLLGRFDSSDCYYHNVSPWYVLRINMSDDERSKFVRCADQLVGTQYDVKRVYQLMLRLALKYHLRRMPLPKLPLETSSNEWICSDAALVLLTGCSTHFKEALTKSKDGEVQLDIFTHGSASFSDFMRIRQLDPTALVRIPLPVMKYTSNPHKRPWKAYAGEFVEMVSRIQSGKLRWHLLEHSVLPRVRAATTRLEHPRTWSNERKAQVLGYVVVLLVIMKRTAIVSRILVRASQLLILRYVIQQLMSHMNLQDVARTMLAKL